MKAGKGALSLWDSSQKAWASAKGWMTGEADQKVAEVQEPVPDAPPVPEETGHEGGNESANASGEAQSDAGNESVKPEEGKRQPMWGKCPCCISCLVTEYFQAENFQGVGQDHLLCLNRGASNTGHEWFEQTLSTLDERLLSAQEKGSGKEGKRRRLKMHVWWGWQDGMVPRKGQLWLNKTLSAHAQIIDLQIHDVPNGDHNDLLGRREGIYEVYEMVQRHGHTTDMSPAASDDNDLDE